MVLETVHEDGNRRLTRHLPRRTNHEVRSAGNGNAGGLAKLGLRLHVVRDIGCGQDKPRLPAHDVFANAYWLAIDIDAAEGLDEPRLQLALEEGVHLHVAQPIDLL